MSAFATESKSRVLLASLGLFLAALFLASHTSRNKDLVQAGAIVIQESLRPAQSILLGGQGILANYWNRYIALRNVESENRVLRQRLLALEAQNSELFELHNDNSQLRSLVGLARNAETRDVIAANIIGYDASNWVQTIGIDQGTQSGIAPGMVVVEGNGLVGHVIAAGPWSSRVLLITDHASSVDGIIQASRARGIVDGAGPYKCTWRFVLADEEVKIGDRIVTSGMDSLYPKGLLVGVVYQVGEVEQGLFKRVEISPSVDFARLEKVLVIRGTKNNQDGLPKVKS